MLSPKHNIYSTSSKAQGVFWKKIQKEYKSWIIEGRATKCYLFSGHDAAIEIMNSQNLWLFVPDLHKTNDVNGHLGTIWLLMDAGGGWVTDQDYVFTGVCTSHQGIVPHLLACGWSWLNSEVHKTKDVNVGKGLLGWEAGRGKREVREEARW